MSAKPNITSSSLPSTSAASASSSLTHKQQQQQQQQQPQQQQQQPDSTHLDTTTSVAGLPHPSKPKPPTWPFKVSPITFVLPSTPKCDLHDPNPNPETRELDIRYKTRYSTKEFSIANSKFRHDSNSITSLSEEKNHEKKLVDKIHISPPHNVEMVTSTSNNLCISVEENKINSAIERLIQDAIINGLGESNLNEFETVPSTDETKVNTLYKRSSERKTVSSQVNMKKEKPIVEIWNDGGIINFKGGFKKLVIRFKNELAPDTSVVDGSSRREDTLGCFNGDVCSLPAEILAAVRDAPINVGESAIQDGQCSSRDGSAVSRCEAASSRGQLPVDLSGIQYAQEFVEDGMSIAFGLSSAARTDEYFVEEVGVEEGSFGVNYEVLRLVKGDELKIEAGLEDGSWEVNNRETSRLGKVDELKNEAGSGVEGSCRVMGEAEVRVREGSCGVKKETEVRVREGSCGVKKETEVRVREGSCGVKKETEVRVREGSCGVKEEAEVRVREGSCRVKKETEVRVREGSCGVKKETEVRVREGSCGVKEETEVRVGEGSCGVKKETEVRVREGSCGVKEEAEVRVREGSCRVKKETEVRVREGSCGVKKETEVRVREGSCGVKEEAEVRVGEGSCGVKEETEVRVGEGSCGVKEEAEVRVREGSCGVKEEAEVRVREGSCGVKEEAEVRVGEGSCGVKFDILRRDEDDIKAEAGVDGEGYEVTGEALRLEEAVEIEAEDRISKGSCRGSNEAEFSGWGKSSGVLSEALRLKESGEIQIEAGVDHRVLVSKLTRCEEVLKEVQNIDESVGEVELKNDDLWSNCDVSERRDETRTDLGEVSECEHLDSRIVNVCNFVQHHDIDFVDDSQGRGFKGVNFVNRECIEGDEGLRRDEDDDESEGRNNETGAKRGGEMGADEGVYADVSEDVYRCIIPSGEACRLAVEDFESNSLAHEDDLDTVAISAKLADTREESSVVVDYDLLDVQRLAQKIWQETRKMNKLISKYKLRVVKVGLLQSYMEQLKEERDEMARILLGVDRETAEIRNDAAELRCTVAAVCDTSVANIGRETDARRLEPACFRRYTNIRTPADASNVLSSVRTRIEALNDLEVLVYRKLITLSHMLPSMHQEKIPHVKGHRFSSGRNSEQIPRSISARSSGVIRVLSDLDNAPDIIALPDSSITLSTPLAIESDGAGSEGYLPGPDE